MTAISKNNVIGKVLSIIGDKMDGDSVLLVDTHFNNALKSVCKFVAETRPVGHEKLLLRQTIPASLISESTENGLTWYTFGIPLSGNGDNLSPIVNTGRFTYAAVTTRDIYDIDTGDARTTGRWTHRGLDDYGHHFWNLEGYADNPIAGIVDSDYSETVTGQWQIYDPEAHGYFFRASGSGGMPDEVQLGEWDINGDVGDSPESPVFTLVGRAKARLVGAIKSLLLSESHGVAYYMIEGDTVYFNVPDPDLFKEFIVEHYIYATADQFPVELEDLLVAELLKLVANEAAKQHNERLENA